MPSATDSLHRQPAQTAFTGAVAEMSAPGAEVIVGYGAAAGLVLQ